MVSLSTLALIGALTTTVAVFAALHVWYAIGLSRVFAARGAEPWRAWIPLVNEAELFRLGRLDPVRAALLIVPGVAVYGLVLKATAAHRLGSEAGRGGGLTALAVVLPPVWAMLLASSGRTPDATSATAEDPVAVAVTPASGPIAAVPGLSASVLPAPEAPSAADPVENGSAPAVAAPVSSAKGSAVAAAPPIVPAPAAVDEPGGAAAPGRRRSTALPVAPPLVPELPGPVDVGVTDLSSADRAVPGGSDPSAVIAAPAAAVPAPAVAPAPAAPAAAPAAAAPAPTSTAPAVAPAAAVVSAAAPSPAAPATRSSLAAADPEVSDLTAPPSEITDATGPARETSEATAGARPPAAAPPIDEATHIARPRSRRRGEWVLALPDGQVVALTARTVVLGRKPLVADEATQYVAVADESRTMSKQHARLEWSAAGWALTDLDSTNGVTLIHDDGRAERLAGGATAPAPARFHLGDALIELRPA